MQAISGRQGTVLLFIKGFPVTFTSHALRRHVLATLRVQEGYTRRQGALGSCDIVRVTDRYVGAVDHYGLLEVRPAKLALRIVRELQGTSLHGRTLDVHRYYQRSLLHERRKSDPPYEAETLPERRREERRRPELCLELVRHPSVDLNALLSWMLPPWFGDKSPEKLG